MKLAGTISTTYIDPDYEERITKRRKVSERIVRKKILAFFSSEELREMVPESITLTPLTAIGIQAFILDHWEEYRDDIHEKIVAVAAYHLNGFPDA